jgi:hypothetical protein
MWDPTKILGYGAIGLGLLLAVLTYNLLKNPSLKERPIYVFQAFCLALVVIGAWLQYTNNSSAADASLALQKELTAVKERLTSADAKASEMQNRAVLAENRLSTAVQVMNAIASSVPMSISKLQSVNSKLTGDSCPGGAHGIGVPGGSQTAALSTAVMNDLAAAKSSIDNFTASLK